MDKVIEIDPVEVLELHIVSEGEHKGWLHTHGMAKYGLPELEMRKIPLFLKDQATDVMYMVADYLLNSGHGKEAKPGMTMGDDDCLVQFVKSTPIDGDEEHFKDERWELTDDAMSGKCECAGCSGCGCSGKETLQ